MDAGWLYTVDEYYVMGVEKILTNVVKRLVKDPKAKYTLGDIYYFRRWYKEQSDIVQGQVKQLVEEGRFDIVHGGLIQTDEACITYDNIIRNLEVGRGWLEREFGVYPTIGW